jgi:hypothetical protein
MAKRVNKDAPAYGITQAELSEYLTLDATAKQSVKVQTAQKESIKKRFLAGESVEPGNLTVLVIPGERAEYTVPAGTTQTFKVVPSEAVTPKADAAA